MRKESSEKKINFKLTVTVSTVRVLLDIICSAGDEVGDMPGLLSFTNWVCRLGASLLAYGCALDDGCALGDGCDGSAVRDLAVWFTGT